MEQPQPGPVRYATLDGSQIAYQVTGQGPIDFVYMLGIGTNFERWWDWPPFAEMLWRFASFGRLILFDRRGSGISDALPPDRLSTWESYAEDLAAILDAAGSKSAVIMACFDSGPIAATFAATNPERVRRLIFWNSYARAQAADDYPIGRPQGDDESMREILEGIWGTEDLTRYLKDDDVTPDVIEWHTKLMRGACTPASYVRQNIEISAADARSALPLIEAPTLVLHAEDYIVVPSILGRYLAENVKDGRYVGLPGWSLDIFDRDDRDEVLDLVEEFATGSAPASRAERFLAGVLFTDIVESTSRAAALGDARWKALLDVHDHTARSVISSWRGQLVKTTGDGLLATFDGPGRAIQSAIDLKRRLASENLEIRAGVHFGEIERRRDGDVGGIAVHVAARALSVASAGEVICTRTVKELSLGSGVSFDDRGTHILRGVPEEWQLFAIAG
jgi:pimeloyl-ACP methyl ester carboxylesterase